MSNEIAGTFSDVRARLEDIVQQVRSKDISLEKSLDLYDEAIRLGNRCSDLIDKGDFSAEEAEAVRLGKQAREGSVTTENDEDEGDVEKSVTAENDDTSVEFDESEDAAASEMDTSDEEGASALVDDDMTEAEIETDSASTDASAVEAND